MTVVPRGSSLDPLSASTSTQGGLEFTSVSNDYPRQRRYCFPWTGDERERARVENNGEDETEEEVKVEEGGGRGDEG